MFDFRAYFIEGQWLMEIGIEFQIPILGVRAARRFENVLDLCGAIWYDLESKTLFFTLMVCKFSFLARVFWHMPDYGLCTDLTNS